MTAIFDRFMEAFICIIGINLFLGIIFAFCFSIYKESNGVKKETTGSLFSKTCESIGGKSVYDGRQYVCLK
jgi:hypothetical protein